MFKLVIDIENRRWVTGLEALDTLRSLGLPDASTFVWETGEMKAEVSEAFARLHFRRDATTKRFSVAPEVLSRGDVVMEGQCVKLAELSTERVKELYLHAELTRLRKCVADLENV